MINKIKIGCLFLIIATSLFIHHNKEYNIVASAINYMEPSVISEYEDGDMNKNGRIDLADIIILLKKYLNDDATNEVIQLGDMNKNGKIDLPDIILLLKKYLYDEPVVKPKGVITLSSQNITMTYGDNGELAYIYNGDGTVSCESENAAYATCSIDMTNHKINIIPVKATNNALTITIKASEGTNYSAADNKNFTITINKKTIASSINTCSNKVYDGNTNANCTLNLNGIESGDTVTANGTCEFANKNVGTGKTVTCSAITLSGENKDNYTLSTPSVSKTSVANITKRSITIKANDQVIGYGENIITGVEQTEITNGTLGVGDELKTITLTPSTSNPTTTGTIMPSAAIIRDGDNNNMNNNYNISYETGNLTISANAATCPKTITDYSGVYDGAKHTITVSSDATGGTVQYRASTSDEWSTTKPTYKDFTNGKAIIYIRVQGNSTHETVTCGSGSVTITKKELTSTKVTAYSTNWVSSGIYTRELSTGIGTDKVSLTYLPYENTAGTYTYDTNNGTGKYTLEYSNNNYNITSADDLTINKVAATCPTTMSNYNATYDGQNHTINVSADATGGIVQYRIGTTGEWVETNPVYKNFTNGTKTIYVQVLGDENHTTKSCNSKTINITKRTLTQSIESCEDKVYDGNNSATCTIGLATVVTGEDVTASGTCNFGNKQVGTGKLVTCSGIALSGNDIDNYSLNGTSASKQGIASIVGFTPIIDFEETNVQYTGSARTANLATVTLANDETFNGTITYTYYGTTNCSGNALSGAPSAIGNYSVKASVAATGNYTASEKCVTHTIVKSDTVTSISPGVFIHDGLPKYASGATAKMISNDTNITNGTFTYTYYNGETCSGNPLSSAPINIGKYSVKVTLAGTSTYNSSTSSCTSHQIFDENELINFDRTIYLNGNVNTIDLNEINQSLNWSSSDTTIATITDNIVSFAKPGSVAIKGRATGSSYDLITINLTVKKRVIIVIGASQVVGMANYAPLPYTSDDFKYSSDDKTFRYVGVAGTAFPYQVGAGWSTAQNFITNNYSDYKDYIEIFVFFPMAGNGILTFACDEISSSNSTMIGYINDYNNTINNIRNEGYDVNGIVVSVQPVTSTENYCAANKRSNKKYYLFNKAVGEIMNNSNYSHLTYEYIFEEIMDVSDDAETYTFKVEYHTKSGESVHLDSKTTKYYVNLMLTSSGIY